MTTRIGNWLGMPDGRRFYPLDPRADEVRIEDIAIALGNTCRWGGRCEPWYSVAQHSLHVMAMVESEQPELALQALLHDAAEAYLGDIVRPLKEHIYVAGMIPAAVGEDQFVEFGHVEFGIQRAIRKAFDLTAPLSLPQAKVIKHADNIALATEARDLMGDPKWPGLAEPSAQRIEPVGPVAAKRAFIEAFERLMAREARTA